MAATDCCICLEATPSPIKTPCGHNYCNKCLTGWLLQKDSCPMCRHKIGKTDKSIVEEDHSNVIIFFDFSGDTYFNLQDYHANLIDDLVNSQINENNEHTWRMWHGMSDYFEYNLRKNKINYKMSCEMYDKKTFFIKIVSQKLIPKYTRKTNDKWVFKSKSALKNTRNRRI